MPSRFLTVAVVGGVATVLVAAALGMTFPEALKLTAIAGAAALVVGALGGLVLGLLRQRPIGTQTMVVALTSVAALAAGALAAEQAMAASSRLLAALVVVLMTAGTVGILVAMVLAERVEAASESLTRSARRIGKGDLDTPVEQPPTGELADVAKELEDMSAKLADSRARQEATERSRRDLVAWVSHDLRTPIARIRAIGEALEDGVLPEGETEAAYLTRLGAEVDRLASLVDDLFELSQINAGLLRLNLEPAVLGDLVSDVVAAGATQAAAKGVDLDISREANPQLPLSVPHIERVLGNLLDNALRYTPAGGAVKVTVEIRDGQAWVAVYDECGGIPAEDMPNLFEVGWSRERVGARGEGAGLGLVIARGIVEGHGGRISAENWGRGCRFAVCLPLPADQASKR